VPEGAAWRLGAFVVEWVVGVVDELDDAALAIVAPPPTSAPVTTRVVIRDFSLRISFLTSLLVLLGMSHDPGTAFERRRRQVRVSYEDPVTAGAAT
jgi:hypothetical protein